MSSRVTIQNVRLSYPHLFTARAIQAGDDPKFGAAFIIPKNHPSIPQILKSIETEKGAKWGANVPPSAKTTLYDGDANPKYNTDPANHGMYLLNASSTQDQPPVLVDMNLQKIINPALLYAGCYVNADIGFYPYDKGVSKGIAAGLNGVQFTADGERLDGRPTAEQMFGVPEGAPAPIAPGVGAPVQPVYDPAPAPATPGLLPPPTFI